MMARPAAVLAASFIAILGATPLHAAGTGGCESFDFPLATELQWMQAPDAVTAASGSKLETPPGKAIAVTLSPTADVSFAVPPTGKPKNDPKTSHAAVITITTLPTIGLYQVSLSGPGWIDVIQDGAPLQASAHTGKSDCEGLRKSVRFELKDGPVTLQLSDVPAPTIKLTIRQP